MPVYDHLTYFHNHLCMQSGAYQNSTWVVGIAKAGNEEGCELLAGSCIVAPSGEIVALASTKTDEVFTAKCDLDISRFNKETLFNFAQHRRIEHYGLITQAGRRRRTVAAGSRIVHRTRSLAAARVTRRSRLRFISREHGAFDQPVEPEREDHGGTSVHQRRMAFLACRRAADPVGQQQNRKDDGHDHHLPDLDADVERCQRRRQRVVGQAIFAQRPGKPEAVNQAERERRPATACEYRE